MHTAYIYGKCVHMSSREGGGGVRLLHLGRRLLRERGLDADGRVRHGLEEIATQVPKLLDGLCGFILLVLIANSSLGG
jgi:hypothetical protein